MDNKPASQPITVGSNSAGAKRIESEEDGKNLVPVKVLTDASSILNWATRSAYKRWHDH